MPLRFELSLAERVAMAPASLPAPTTPPRRAALAPSSVELGLRSALRRHEEELGLGAPERRVVTEAIRAALWRTPAPSETRVAYEVALDVEGRVTSMRRLRASGGDEPMWRETDRTIARSLGVRAIPLGVDARRAGVRLVVVAVIVHALPQGSVDGTATGPCPRMPDEGGIVGSGREMFPSARFFDVVGESYGAPPMPICTLREDADALRHIEVRATTSSFFEGEPVPPSAPERRILDPWGAPELAGPMMLLRTAASILPLVHPDVAETLTMRR